MADGVEEPRKVQVQSLRCEAILDGAGEGSQPPLHFIATAHRAAVM